MEVSAAKAPGRIMLYSGKMFDIQNPEADDFDIRDIAHALSLKCRYNGQCNFFYSVAQHSFYTSYILPPELQMAALLHDATEAYMQDLPRPLKVLLPDYIALEHALGRKIAVAFGLDADAFEGKWIKMADDKMMALEATVMVSNPQAIFNWVGTPDASIFDIDRAFQPWMPPQAEARFLSRFHELQNEAE